MSFQAKGYDLVLAIPEILDYAYDFKIKYSGVGGKENDYNDVYIGGYRNHLNENVYCLDGTYLDTSSRIEPCDLIAVKDNRDHLIHNKIPIKKHLSQPTIIIRNNFIFL